MLHILMKPGQNVCNAQSTYNVTHSYETRSKCLKYIDGKCQYYREYTVPCESRDMLINVTPKLTSISTGQVVYANILTWFHKNV